MAASKTAAKKSSSSAPKSTAKDASGNSHSVDNAGKVASPHPTPPPASEGEQAGTRRRLGQACRVDHQGRGRRGAHQRCRPGHRRGARRRAGPRRGWPQVMVPESKGDMRDGGVIFPSHIQRPVAQVVGGLTKANSSTRQREAAASPPADLPTGARLSNPRKRTSPGPSPFSPRRVAPWGSASRTERAGCGSGTSPVVTRLPSFRRSLRRIPTSKHLPLAHSSGPITPAAPVVPEAATVFAVNGRPLLHHLGGGGRELLRVA